MDRITKLFRSLIVCCFAFLAVVLPPKAHALSGAGTEASPYVISNVSDLAAMHNDLSAYYVLGANIDVKNAVLTPVGNELEGAFTGTLDGRGFTISNLTMNLPDNKYVGLFGYLEGRVMDLKLSSITLTGCRYVGGVAGHAGVGSAVTDCEVVSGTITASGDRISVNAGGIVGMCSGSLKNCENRANITTSNLVYGIVNCTGGIAGSLSDDIVELSNCANHGDVLFSFAQYYSSIYLGGIVGRNMTEATLSGNRNFGSISSNLKNSGVDEYYGGIIGQSGAKLTLLNCANYAPVKCSGENAGGVLGSNGGDAILTGCSNSGKIENSGGGAGGIVGRQSRGTATLTNCTNSGEIRGRGYGNDYGGMIGELYIGTASLEGCVNSGDIRDHYFGSGMVGQVSSGSSATREKCVNTGNTSGEATIQIGPASHASGDIFTLTPGRMLLSGANRVYCSDLQCNYIDGSQGYSLYELQDPDSAAYAGWKSEEWVFDAGRNSGLPMPVGCDVDYMDQSILIMTAGESTSLTPPFTAASWTSYDNGVAVCVGGTVTAKGIGTTCVTAWNSDHTRRSNCIVYVYEKKPSVALSQKKASVAYGSSLTLTTDLPKGDPQGIIWTSSDNRVATVSQTGVVTGNKAGKAVITASLPLSNVSASCEIEVTRSSSFSLANATVNVGEAVSINVWPTNASYYNQFVWASSDENIAAVSEDGVVTGVKAGTVIVTATAGSAVETCTVTVKQPAEGVSLDRTALTLESGLSFLLTAHATPEDQTDTLTWTSGNSNVATVSNGLVAAKSIGRTPITVKTSSGKSATCLVTVVAPTVQPLSIALDQTLLRPIPGEKVQLTATVLPSDATDKSVTWESSNPDVATVSNTGVVEAVSYGETTITARTVNGLWDTCQVKVVHLSNAAFIIPDSRGSINDTFETTVQLVKNPGVAAFTLDIDYDASALTPLSVTAGELLSAGTLNSNVGASPNGTLQVVYYSDADFSGDGALFTIRWQAGADAGSYPLALRYAENDICNAKQEEVRVGSENGGVMVLDRPIGDIYHDDLVDMKDIVYFARYFIDQETLDAEQKLAADLFYDGEVDVKDLSVLAQVLSEDLPQNSSLNAHRNLLAAPTARLLGAGENTSFRVSVGDTVLDGDTAVLTVSGSDCSGIAAMRFRIVAPDGFAVAGVQACDLLGDGAFAYNEETNIVTWYSAADQILNGDLFTVTLLKNTETKLPANLELNYSSADFFSIDGYNEVPIITELGTISLAPYISIVDMAAAASSVTVLLESNMDDDVLLMAAFYQDGRMVSVSIQNIESNRDKYTVELPVSGEEFECKVFLLDPVNYKPLTESQRMRVK